MEAKNHRNFDQLRFWASIGRKPESLKKLSRILLCYFADNLKEWPKTGFWPFFKTEIVKTLQRKEECFSRL